MPKICNFFNFILCTVRSRTCNLKQKERTSAKVKSMLFFMAPSCMALANYNFPFLNIFRETYCIAARGVRLIRLTVMAHSPEINYTVKEKYETMVQCKIVNS